MVSISAVHPRQQRYIAIAVAIYAALWAAGRPVRFGTTLIYTLSLCNFIVLIQDHLEFPLRTQAPSGSWAIYLRLAAVISVCGRDRD